MKIVDLVTSFNRRDHLYAAICNLVYRLMLQYRTIRGSAKCMVDFSKTTDWNFSFVLEASLSRQRGYLSCPKRFHAQVVQVLKGVLPHLKLLFEL